MTKKSHFKIPFCKPTFDDKEIKAVTKVLQSGWWTSGKISQEFEIRFAKYVGAKYCVFVNSGTSALKLAIEYNKHIDPTIKRVLVPSLTFAATVNEVVHAGLEPVFGDVYPDNMCLKVEGQEYDMVIPVHLTGNPAIDAPSYYNCPVIEDSAHLIEKNQCLLSQNLVCFSFYATKNISTGEGGMIATNSKKAYDWLMQARHHGISKDGWNRLRGGSWRYDIEFTGWKANQSDLLAALGIEQLKKFPKFDIARRRIVKRYNKNLGYDNHGLHLYPIKVSDRSSFIDYMASKGIQCSVHFLPVHLMSAYKSKTRLSITKLPITEDLGDVLVSLPLYPTMTNIDVDKVCREVLNSGCLIPKNI